MTKTEQIRLANLMRRVAIIMGDHDRTVGALLREAHECAAREERGHRRFGRSLVGDIGARLSVSHTAWLFVARGFFGADHAGPHTVAGLAMCRDDYRSAIMARFLAAERLVYGTERTLYALARGVFNVPDTLNTPYGVDAINQWDYVRDVAGRR